MKKFMDKVYKAETVLLGLMMLFAALLLFTNVVLRYFFHSAIFWVEETLRYVTAWVIFIGISNCVRSDSHISVDILPTYGGPKVRFVIDILVNTIGIAFGGIFGAYSVKYLLMIAERNQMAATLGDVPMWIIYLCMPLGCALYALTSLERLIHVIKTGPVNKSAIEIAAEAAEAEGGEQD